MFIKRLPWRFVFNSPLNIIFGDGRVNQLDLFPLSSQLYIHGLYIPWPAEIRSVFTVLSQFTFALPLLPFVELFWPFRIACFSVYFILYFFFSRIQTLYASSFQFERALSRENVLLDSSLVAVCLCLQAQKQGMEQISFVARLVTLSSSLLPVEVCIQPRLQGDEDST